MAFDLFRSGASNERRAFEGGTNPLVRARLMQLLSEANPNRAGAEPTFESALGEGKFDGPNLSILLDMLRRRHAPQESQDRAGAGSWGGMM